MAIQLKSVVKTLTVSTDTAKKLNAIKKKYQLKTYEEAIICLLNFHKLK